MNHPTTLSNILFFDVECVPQNKSYFDLDEAMQWLREKKAKYMLKNSTENETAWEVYENRSGIFAEFGKIVTISVGTISKDLEWNRSFRVKSFAGDDEKKILEEFFELLNTHYTKAFHRLCGHNIKEFDVPYICRRALVNGIALPDILDVGEKKPREVNFLDTLTMWKFWDRKNFTSLDLLCRIMDIPTPKDGISGEDVAGVYRSEKNLSKITEYCEKDVIATARLYLRMRGRQAEMPEEIVVA